MNRLSKRFPIYSKLLRLYPAPYREVYGEQMLQTLADMLDDKSRKQSAVWLRAVVDFPFSMAKQQLLYSGGIMKNDMPRFVKWNAVVGGVLLLPFASAVVANGLNEAIYGHTLYQSWLWHMPVLAIWVLWLPLVAAGLALISLVIFLRQRSKVAHASWWKVLLDWRRNWPLLVVAVLGLGIMFLVLFHDSVHCVTGNPAREIQHWQQTWQCIQRG